MREASVIFDTNSYRNLTKNLNRSETIKLFERINKTEKEKSIISFATHVVASELLSHLNDESDPHYRNCRNGAIALYHHNLQDREGNLRFIADSESQLCHILYERKSPHEVELSKQLNSDLHFIYNRKESEGLLEISENLEYLKSSLENSEVQFVEDMWNFVVKTANTDAQEWSDVRDNPVSRKKALRYIRSNDPMLHTAKGLVLKAMFLLNENDTKEQIADKAKYLTKIFDAPIKFYNQILEKILVGGANVENKSRANWLWDLQLAFYIGNKKTISGLKTYLITSDKDILKVAEDIGCEKYVFTVNDYLSKIGLNLT